MPKAGKNGGSHLLDYLPQTPAVGSIGLFQPPRSTRHAKNQSDHPRGSVWLNAMPHASRSSEAHRPLGLLGRFPHPISVYGQIPSSPSAQVDVFEAATAHRLRVLHFLDEKFGLDSSTNPALLRSTPGTPAAAAGAVAPTATPTKPLYVQLEEMLQEGGLMLPPAASATATEAQRQEVSERDCVSHFALRLAFSRDRDKQRWLIQQESRLLMYRFERLCAFRDLSDGTLSLVSSFLQQEGLHYATVPRPRDPVANSAAERLWRKATSFLRGPFAQQVQQLYIISLSSSVRVVLSKVPCFPDAGQLVRNRRVYIQNMMAYVPDTELDAVICGKLRGAMTKSFELLEGRQVTLQNSVFSDSRVGKLLTAAPTVYLGRDFNKNVAESTEERLTPQSIKLVWKDSFPPCMRRLYESYMAEHHLRHGGRMQLWLFFKTSKPKQCCNLKSVVISSSHARNISCKRIQEALVRRLEPQMLQPGDDVGNHPNAFFAASRRYAAAVSAGPPAAGASKRQQPEAGAPARQQGASDTPA
ncbi:hypothetical protein cyc_00411 [Cyclospora cayetanensis]|uniref:DNA primase large subunit C-terminal domain-containing protein n=1 Tax=Cyclospora cayetanensis TaxID=88456 RepID=A0A1D3CTR9_9EIME|nr:hypothetical protein cyc_00411 [Cyclospora cayetanensis]